MRSLKIASFFIAIVLTGCANKGVMQADSPPSETFSVSVSYQTAYRRAGEYVRVCHEQTPHAYGVIYQSLRTQNEKGALNEIKVFKQTEPAKVLALILAQSDGAAHARVTVTVLGEGRWDAAEIAAAKASIQSATPVCRAQ